MAELVKPKRKKTRQKERLSVPISLPKSETVTDKNESLEAAEATEVHKAADQVVCEAAEITEVFESTKELNHANVAVEEENDSKNDMTADNDVKELENRFSAMVPTAPLADFDVGFFPEPVVRVKEPENILNEETRMIELITLDLENEIEKNYVKEDMRCFTEKELEEFYYNEELNAAANFLNDFSNQSEPEQDEFYKLLLKYSNLRENGRELETILENSEIDLKKCVKDLWTFWPKVVFTQSGKCGHDRKIMFKHTYQQARLNSEESKKLQEIVANRKQTIKLKWINNFDEELQKAAIWVFIWSIEKNTTHLLSDNILINISSRNSDARECVDQLCRSLGTLFYFLRKIPKNLDEEFVKELQDVTATILGILIRIGGYREHLLILAHILCCPPGIALWALDYVQCPAYHADHACALLSLLLQPIDKREEFLKHRLDKNPWLVVDDEDGLELDTDSGVVCETVLFQLLDQIPFRTAFAMYLTSDSSEINEYSYLKLLGFFTKILELFQMGLKSYNHDNYRQLLKKLGKMIRNILQLATDQLELFPFPNILSRRIQVEYDAFWLRAARALLSQPPVWQFLATAPFHRISLNARWQLFWEIIHPENFATPDADTKRELCHLITTLCHLALAPGAHTEQLVRLAALHTFNVGFVYPEAWDSCYKDAKSALSALVADNNYLIGELLEVNFEFLEKETIPDKMILIELWQAMPVEQWRPYERDVKLLSLLILKPTGNEIAREIFSRLNYAELSYSIQKSIAWAILRAAHRNTSEANFNKIYLNILCKLRLHLADRSDIGLMDIPDMADDTELGIALAEKLCCAVYVALETTSVGHFVPVIYSNGFKLVRILYDNGHYEAAFSTIDHLTTMFWHCPESLTSCQDFINLLADIVTSDGLLAKVVTYLRGNNNMGPILKKFIAMLTCHLDRSSGQYLPKSINLWMMAVTALPLWQTCPGAVLVLDHICRIAFTNPPAWFQVLNFLEKILPTTQCVATASPVASWFGLKKIPPMPSLLPNGFGKCAPWFAYAAISVEFEAFEVKTGLWKHLMQEMWDEREHKINIDQILKKICGNLRICVRNSNELAFYRWAYLALEMPCRHELTIMVWLKLMELYLSRVPGLANRGCPGDVFLNNQLKQKLLTQLKILETTLPNSAEIFQNFAIWIRKQTVKDSNLMISMLPAEFNPSLLASVLNKETHLWIGMLPLAQIQDTTSKIILTWTAVLGRQPKIIQIKENIQPESVDVRIQKRLKEFTEPKPLPKLLLKKSPVYAQDLNDPNLNDAIFSWFLNIDEFINYWDSHSKDIANAESSILRNAGKIYHSTELKVVLKEGCTDYGNPCRDEGRMILNLENWVKDEGISAKFDKAVEDFTKNLIILSIPKTVVKACCSIDYIVKMLLENTLHTQAPLIIFEQLFELWKKANQNYSPIAQFSTKCLMDLGKKYVYRNPRYLKNLLRHIFSTPNATFLHSLFDPNDAKQSKFLEIYKMILENSNDDTLLSKCNVKLWLENCKVERKTAMIRAVFDVLRKKNNIELVLNRHLEVLILNEFPKQFFMILELLIESADKINPPTWYTILNCLSAKELKLEKFDLEDVFEFAVDQNRITIHFLQFAIKEMDRALRDIRQRNKKTVYEHFGQNSECVLSFCTTVVKSAVIFLKSNDSPVLDTIKIDEILAPWLVPFSITPNELQQPFSQDYAASAGYAAACFTELIRFLIKNFPENEDVLNYTLRFYLYNFCHTKVDGLVLSVMHSSLVSLPWYQIKPTLVEVEAIFNAMNQSIPLSHSFLGNIFVSADWETIITKNIWEINTEMNARLHVCLLHLLVKFRSDISFKNNKAIDQLLDKAIGFKWNFVDAVSYNSATALFVMAMNPEVVLEDAVPDTYDAKIIKLLQTAAGYGVGLTAYHETTPLKRIIFVSTIVKCLATAALNRKRTIEQAVIYKVISKLLTDVEVIVTATVPDFHRVNEACSLLTEILKCLNETKLSSSVEGAIIEWFTVTDAKLVMTAFFHCGGQLIENSIFYTCILEAAIEGFFANTGMSDWLWLTHIINTYSNGPMEQLFISNNNYLGFCVLALKTLATNMPRSNLTAILQIFSSLKPREDLEPKLILLMALALTAIPEETDALSLFVAFADNLLGFTADRSSFLSAIVGKFSSNSFSVKFKLCCGVTVVGLCSILLTKYNHISDEKTTQFLDKAERSKIYAPVLPCLLNAKKDLIDLTEIAQLVSILLKTADQLYNKNYFLSFDTAVCTIKNKK